MIANRPVWMGFLLFVAGLAYPMPGARAETLDEFVRSEGLIHTAEFDRTIVEIRTDSRLPADLYVTKRGAESLGWHRGANLCPWLAGKMIGGDYFDNRDNALPAGGIYREADLDEEDCGRRGAKRLVFDNGGDIWVTVDHYRSFQRVP